MVRRGIAALAWLPLVALAGPGEIDQIERDEIREEAQMDILREPAAVDVEPDVAAVRRMFARPAMAPERPKQDPLPVVQLTVQPEGIPAGQMLALVARTIGYRTENPDALALEETVQLSTKARAVPQLLAAIETQARCYVSLFPEQKLLVVHRRRHATR